MIKLKERGRGKQTLGSEQQMEKTVVRDRADSLGRKGVIKRPATSPPSPGQEGRRDR